MRAFAIPLLVVVNLACTVVANTAFKISAQSNVHSFLTWQLVGNIAGFATVLTLTGLLRFLPLSHALAITSGLGFLGVQVLAANMFFHEAITFTQWIGILGISGGIILVCSGR
jgi:multidrug transporter EmrE-like cation transporter